MPKMWGGFTRMIKYECELCKQYFHEKDMRPYANLLLCIPCKIRVDSIEVVRK